MRRHLIIFLAVLLLTGTLSFMSQSQAVAELAAHYKAPGEVTPATLVLAPAGSLDAIPSPETSARLMDARQVISYRLKKLGVPGPHQVNLREGKLEVTLPENSNTPYVLNILTSVGKIEFIDGGLSSPPVGQHIQTGPNARPNRHIYRALFSGEDVEQVSPPDTASGQIFYNLTLKPTAALRFANFVKETPNAYVCMALDERVINCSRMYHYTGQGVEILPDLGSGTAISLADLGVFLEGGPLPLPLSVLES